MPRERGQIPYFKDAATPADIADGGGVTGYAATGSSPRAGGAVSSHGPLRHAPGIIPTRAGSSFPGIGYTCFGVDRIRPGIRSGYRDAGSFALDDVLPAVPVEHDDVALLDESELHRLGGLLKRRVKRNGVEAVRLPVRTALLQNKRVEAFDPDRVFKLIRKAGSQGAEIGLFGVFGG